MQKQWLFKIIALLIPIGFFVLLEFGLRLAGVGQSTPLFIENPAHNDYILPRPDIMSRYFPADTPMPPVSLEANFLLREKPDNSIRIFVQGGSTAAGYPYGLGASLAGMLDHRLKRSLPNHHVEVVNTAMSAVNSFTLLDLADEIIEQQPDAVLIYAGHNEYLGILGVGSNFTMGSGYWLTRSMLSLKDLRLYQALQSLVFAASSSSASAEESTSRRTMMSQVAKHKDIEFESDIYHAGIAQFERNMQALLAKYKAADIPVFIATIASNHRHQAPFNSADIPADLSAKLATATSIESLSQLSRAHQNSTSAAFHFQLASKLITQRAFELAKQHFVLAKEHDLLRFRAPVAINNKIQILTENEDTYLVDVNTRMEQRSEGGVIGNNLMLEHLHPNVEGYFVIADSFYEAIKTSGIFESFKPVSINDAWRARPILPSEEYYGYASVLTLMSDYPFTAEPKPVRLPRPADWQQELGRRFFEKEIDWLGMTKQAAEGYKQSNNTSMWIKSLQLIADALPHDPMANIQVGELLYKQKRYSEAKYYLQRAKRAGAVGSLLDQQIAFAVANS